MLFEGDEMQMRVRLLWTAFVLCMLSAISTWAQLYTGSITGTVTDATGAVVPNAKVTVTDISRGFEFTANTDESGTFVARNLPPSTYSVRVEATGFSPTLRDNVVLNVNQNVTVPVTLAVGA